MHNALDREVESQVDQDEQHNAWLSEFSVCVCMYGEFMEV
jgi:hypothetical protein